MLSHFNPPKRSSNAEMCFVFSFKEVARIMLDVTGTNSLRLSRKEGKGALSSMPSCFHAIVSVKGDVCIEDPKKPILQ